jgi:hypothetical protein
MASTYSDLKIELIGTGDQSGTWGATTNANLGTAVSEAITGSADVAFTSAADVTVTLTDTNTAQTARNLRLNITESGAGIGYVGNLILGSGCQIEKFYVVNNGTTAVKTIKNTTGTGVAIPANSSVLVFNNGTNVVQAVTAFGGTGAILIPVGTTAQQPSGVNGQIRYNTTQQTYEGYSNGAWGQLGGGATGGGPDKVFVQNQTTVTTNYTLTTGYNAESVGPIQINSGITVTVPSGQRWVIL